MRSGSGPSPAPTSGCNGTPTTGLSGNPLERRAIQLGLRGDVLARYAREWLLGIEDISDFVAEQRANAKAPYERLVTPREDVYPVADTRGRCEAGGVGDLIRWSMMRGDTG